MTLYIWRHPTPLNATGLCLGQTDVEVDKRKLRRLANQIQRFARRNRLEKVIWVSPLQRSLGVGKILAQRGFRCEVTPALAEVDFGHWDGRPWQQIPRAEMDLWCEQFADYAPSGGENLRQLFARVALWLAALPDTPRLAVGHAGWINAARLLVAGRSVPTAAGDWPRPVAYRALIRLTIPTVLPAPVPPPPESC
ncbi:histidine phosphatase family protein [Oceanisphaera sp. KMM 10153]|uniref:histidine phosphatase family protein n=1 Tax=Oceanisphaera submarina TaxID=3390193 RepID=UPI0039766FA9